jgi:CRP-like cAMP-binding protein
MITPEPQAQLCSFRRHEFLARVGEPQQRLYRLEEGWACRFRVLRDGRRQIVGLFLPGELCEPQWLLSQRADLPVVALTTMRVTPIDISALDLDRPGAAGPLKLVFGAMLQALNTQADWIVSLGRKTATERLCALICDLFRRLRNNGRVVGDRFPMPLTQYDLADIAGLTPVHVNRVLKTLRHQGIIEFKSKSMRIVDHQTLQKMAAE